MDFHLYHISHVITCKLLTTFGLFRLPTYKFPPTSPQQCNVALVNVMRSHHIQVEQNFPVTCWKIHRVFRKLCGMLCSELRINVYGWAPVNGNTAKMCLLLSRWMMGGADAGTWFIFGEIIPVVCVRPIYLRRLREIFHPMVATRPWGWAMDVACKAKPKQWSRNSSSASQ